jgi:hypothetical protein
MIIGCLALVAPAGAKAALAFVPGAASFSALNADGTSDMLAGSHPGSLTLHFDLKTNAAGETEGGTFRNAVVKLPPGMVGNPQAVPACSQQAFESETCASSSQVGVLRVNTVGSGGFVGPVYNLAPPPATAAEMGFKALGFFSRQYASVRADEGYRLGISAINAPLPVASVTETIWGFPSDSDHDSERGEKAFNGGPPVASEAAPNAYLSLPTSCAAPLSATIEVDTLEDPGNYTAEVVQSLDGGGSPQPLTGCDSVPFSPTVLTTLSSGQSESSAGLNFQLQLPNHGLLSPLGINETEPSKTGVTLPAGVTVNPSAAGGIVGCTLAQYRAADGEAGVGCPEASKLGTLVARTPLLEEAIEGSVFLAAPHDNPFDSLLALYIVAKAPERGVLVKQAGLVEADPTTGQLTTTFDNLPPLPYSSFELGLREGPRAPLITPQACGEYNTVAKLYPFSAPGSPVERAVPFKITAGAGGGACAATEAQQPNRPSFEAGTAAPVAAAFSPFVFRVGRQDGDQRFSSVQATLPVGLLGKLAGIPYCSDAAIAVAASRTQEGGGSAEIASPSCPATSQVGTVNVSAGAGSQPYVVQGKVYLAGPYKGAPLSLEIVTPAIAGPFDLGSVAVRTALYVNEVTAQIHAVSDPLPTILHGIPLDLRAISLRMDRPEFTLNPTNCSAKSVTGSVTSLVGQSRSVSDPFGVGGCSGLAFEPTLKLSFAGQTKRTGYPALKAVLTQPKGQNANLAGASVILPKGMLIANAHINNPCTRVQFNSTPVAGEGCPPKSVLGTAKVWSPLLGTPEQGNVYFRSNGGERQLPDLVVALRGQIPLQLVGFIDSVGKKGAEVRRVRGRFQNLPDAPVSRFELKLAGGKKGLLQNSENLCKVSDRATFALTGQNGKTHDTEPKVQVSCGKAGKKKGAGKRG